MLHELSHIGLNIRNSRICKSTICDIACEHHTISYTINLTNEQGDISFADRYMGPFIPNRLGCVGPLYYFFPLSMLLGCLNNSRDQFSDPFENYYSHNPQK